MTLSKVYKRLVYNIKNRSLAGALTEKLFETKLGFLVNTKLYNLFYRKIVSRKINSIKWPVYINIENTNICNAKCKMCPREHLNRPLQAMDFGLFKKIIDDLRKNIPVEKIILNGYGEPLADPHIFERLEYIKKTTSIPILFFTNASLMSEKIRQKLIDLEVDEINISFNGYDKRSYDEAMGKLKYEQVSENIKALHNLKQEQGKSKPLVYMSCVVLEKFDRKAFKKQWNPYVDGIFFTPAQTWGGGYFEEPSAEKFGYKEGKWPCRRLWDHMFIGADGKVFLCCNDYNGKYVLGDAAKTPIIDIYNSEKLKAFRQVHKEFKFDKIPICKDCDALNKCSTLWWPK